MNPGGPHDSPGRQRLRRLAGALFIGAIILFGLQIRLPFFILAPGITRPAHELVQVDTVSGEESEEPVSSSEDSGFLITTLAARQATAGKLLLAILDPASSVVPRSSFLPPGMNMDEYVAENRELMRQSQLKAMAAAFNYLGMPATLEGEGFFVRAVLPRSPSEGKLQTGDVIIAAQGTEVTLQEDLARALRGLSRGDRVSLKIDREGEELDTTVALASTPSPIQPWAALGLIGSTASLRGDFPENITVTIEADNIAGPSAGLAFGLEILNRILDTDLTGGQLVAVTGTLAHDGEIGPVGGVAFKARAAKAAGAAVFIVPEDNGDEARRARQVEVVAASRFEELVEILLARREETADGTSEIPFGFLPFHYGNVFPPDHPGTGGKGRREPVIPAAAAPFSFDTAFNP